MNEDNIMLIGLISGAIIVAEATPTEGNSMQLNAPLAIVQMNDEKTDRLIPAFVPYAPYAEKNEVLLSSSAIEYVAVPKTKLIEQYRTTITGIVVPSKSVIATA